MELDTEMFASPDFMNQILKTLYAKPESDKVKLQIDTFIDVLDDLITKSGFDPNTAKGILYNLTQKDLNVLYKAIIAAKRHS